MWNNNAMGSSSTAGRLAMEPSQGARLASLFSGSDDSSDDAEQDKGLGHRRRSSAGEVLSPADAAEATTFLGDKDNKGRRRSSKANDQTSLSSSMPRSSRGSPKYRKDHQGSSSLPRGWRSPKRGAVLSIQAGLDTHADTTSSPLHADSGGVRAGNKVDDLEAARGTSAPSSSPSITISEVSSEFKLNQNRSPIEWIRVGDTTGTFFLWCTVVMQAASAFVSVVFLTSAAEDQVSWKTGCWGSWTSLADAQGIAFVQFDTHIGWQLYGKDKKFGYLSEISRSTAIVGGLAGAMHTLVVLFSCSFLLFSLSTLCMSYGQGSGLRESEKTSSKGEDVITVRDASPLVLGRNCHRWMFVMATADIIAGFWCAGVGCFAFYMVITGDFTDGIEKLLGTWGESVTCAAPQTSPRYGFFANAAAIIILLGGGIFSLVQTYSADRELSEAVDMWRRDRAEEAEVNARMAVIRKRDIYAAAAAAAAASAIAVERIGKSKASAPVSSSSGATGAKISTAASAAAAGTGPAERQKSNSNAPQGDMGLDVGSEGGAAFAPDSGERAAKRSPPKALELDEISL